MTIQNARSNTSGRVPSALQDGQIAINQADGVLFSRNPDGTIRRTLLPKRTTVADATFVIRGFDTYIGISSLTASRAITLPAASVYPPGHPLTIADEAGACSPTIAATITAAGSDKINGNPTYGMTQAYLGIILFSDGVSKWTAIALPGSGASNAVLYVAQSLTAGQQDQARLNVSGAASAFPSATTSLAALDLDRDQFVTGTATLTMPGAAPGWRSGLVTNDNTQAGIVTLAVPSGHMLDGVANGSLKLYPRQSARLRLVSSGTWRTAWGDRTPIIASISVSSPIASVDVLIPSGYTSFEFFLAGIKVDTSGASLGVRASYDNGATFKSGTTDYFFISSTSTNSIATGGNTLQYWGTTSSLPLADTLSVSDIPTLVRGSMVPGAASTRPTFQFSVLESDSGGFVQTRNCSGLSQTPGLATAIRFLVSSGNLTAGQITLRGLQ